MDTGSELPERADQRPDFGRIAQAISVALRDITRAKRMQLRGLFGQGEGSARDEPVRRVRRGFCHARGGQASAQHLPGRQQRVAGAAGTGAPEPAFTSSASAWPW